MSKNYTYDEERDMMTVSYDCPKCGQETSIGMGGGNPNHSTDHLLKDVCFKCRGEIYFSVGNLLGKYKQLKADKKEENIRRAEVELIKALITAKKRSKYMTREVLDQVDDVKNEVAFEDSYLRAGFRMSMLDQLEEIEYKLNGWIKVAGRHEEIAERIDTDKATLKKALARLIVDNTVEYNGEYIRLLDDVEE